MSIIQIHNAETGEIIEREMTAEEIADKEKRFADKLARLATEEEAKIKRQALLDKLGITEDEARLLLGGN
jgi:hypothetical protein